jgi:tetratricopeptide (TPR) repeat protein
MHKIYFSVLIFICSVQLVLSQPDSLFTSGCVKQKAGNHESAIMDFSAACKKHDPEVQDYVKKWDESQKFTDFERAEKGLEIPAIDASFARSYLFRGISYAAMNKNEEALNDLNTAVKINPKSGQAYYERGKLVWLSGKKYEACCDIRMAMSLGDSMAKEMFDEKFCWNEAKLYYNDAVSKLKLNQFETAFELVQKSIQLCPDSISYYIARGRANSGMGKLDLGLNDFDKVIAVLPENADAYFGRGLTYYSKRKYQEAFDDFDKAVHINESFADAYLYRAYACEGMGKVQSALYDYQQVQHLRPNDPLAYYKSGLLKNDNNDPKGACADFRKAAALGHPDAGDYLKSCK